jgi:hypothetical protein
MQPRISTLLDSPSNENNSLNLASSQSSPEGASRRPHLEDRVSAGGHSRTNASNFPEGFTAQAYRNVDHSQSYASIARVLNNATSAHHGLQSSFNTLTSPTVFLNARLDDAVPEPFIESSSKRRRLEDNHAQPSLHGGESSLIKLPELPQLPKKTTRRPRIPPLLQGLHQPPPLPEGRLFPPITSESSGFDRDVGERRNISKVISTGKLQERDPDTVNGAVRREASERVEKEQESRDKLATTQEVIPGGTGSQSGAGSPDNSAAQNKNQGKETRKRNKWSEQETRDLLLGVSKFGIGKWKRILQCSEFNFDGRNAVDLKDRFRVCCPAEGLKPRKPRPRKSEIEKPRDGGAGTEKISARDIAPVRTENHGSHRRVVDRVGPAELAEMGIQEPFVKSKRRQRHAFSEVDDQNLLKGYEKYGAVWHSIRNDEQLGFSARHPTDLRDRFRIRYPEIYAKAGYKLKPKDERLLKERGNSEKQDHAQSPPNTTRVSDTRKNSEDQQEGDVRRQPESTIPVTTTPSVTHITTMIPQAPVTPQFDSMFGSFDGIANLTSGDADGDSRSIVLNRNILQWADANTLSLSLLPSAPNTLHASNHNINDMHFNPFATSDGLHINPLATLKLPSATYHANKSTHAPSLPTPASLRHYTPTKPDTNTSDARPAAPKSNITNSPHPSNSISADRNQAPNLPTIVFPYVPVASARSTVHNLPRPADLLSGIEGHSDRMEWAPQQQQYQSQVQPSISINILDDEFGFAPGPAYPRASASATVSLAPLLEFGAAGHAGVVGERTREDGGI